MIFSAGHSPGLTSCFAVIGDPAAFFSTGHGRTVALTCFTGAFDPCQESGKNITGGGAVTCSGCFILLFLADIQVLLNVGPASDHNEADNLPAFLGIGSGDRCIQFRDHVEDHLDAFIRQRHIAVFDLTILGIGKHDLQNRIEDMALAVIFLFDQLLHRGHVLILGLTHFLKTAAQDTRELIQNTGLHIAILQHICDKGSDVLDHLKIPLFSLGIAP